MSRGSLTVYTGPMFAGKTGRLLDAAVEHDAVVVKPSMDDRYTETEVTTHDGRSLSAYAVDDSGFVDLVEREEAEAVCIDEANFFDDGLVETIEGLRDDGYACFVAGLDRDFRKEGFEPVPELIDAADAVVRLTADCASCDDEAAYSQRLIDGEPAPYETDQIMVGGEESYEPRCGGCHELG